MLKSLNFIIPVLLFTGGCTTLYVPSSHHVPMMEEKGEVHLSGNIGNNGLNLHGGASISNQIGLVGTLQVSNFTFNADEDRSFRYFDGGINYFRPLSERVKSEFILGLGYGKGESEQWDGRFDEGEFTRFFLQANSSLKESQTEAGLSLRLSYVRFTEFESTRNVSGLLFDDLFFEPAAFIFYGLRNVRLESQFGYSFSLNGSSNLAFNYQYIRLSVGTRVTFN